MKSPPPLGRARRAGKNRLSSAVPLKVFIAYGDVPAVRRASATVGRAMREAHRHVELQPMLWRFQQLESSHWCDRAISAALEADIIVLASSTSGPLSAALEAWVDAFLAANRGRRATIVSISGTNDAWTISIEQSVAEAATPPIAVAVPPPAAKALGAAKSSPTKQRLVA